MKQFLAISMFALLLLGCNDDTVSVQEVLSSSMAPTTQVSSSSDSLCLTKQNIWEKYCQNDCIETGSGENVVLQSSIVFECDCPGGSKMYSNLVGEKACEEEQQPSSQEMLSSSDKSEVETGPVVSGVELKYLDFVPNSNVREHSQKITIHANNLKASELDVTLLYAGKSNTATVHIPVSDIKKYGTGFYINWRCVDGIAVYQTGIWKVIATVRGSNIQHEASFEIHNPEPEPQITIEYSTDSLVYPSPDTELIISSDKKTQANFALMKNSDVCKNLLGNARSEEFEIIEAGETRFAFDIGECIPNSATGYWLSEKGQFGWFGVALSVSIDSLKITPKGELKSTIQPSIAGNEWQFVFDANMPGVIDLKIKHNFNTTYQVQSKIIAGENRISWDGRTNDGVIVEDGRYDITIMIQDNIPGMSQRLYQNTHVQVK